MKTLKVEIPIGFEIDKEKSTFEEIVFKPIKKEFPKSWKELGKIEGFYLSTGTEIYKAYGHSEYESDRNLFATEDQAQAAIALSQLSQLREVYCNGWKPDWNDTQKKHCIYFNNDRICVYDSYYVNEFLSFQDAETRDLFLHNFRDLIEQAKPLLA